MKREAEWNMLNLCKILGGDTIIRFQFLSKLTNCIVTEEITSCHSPMYVVEHLITVLSTWKISSVLVFQLLKLSNSCGIREFNTNQIVNIYLNGLTMGKINCTIES